LIGGKNIMKKILIIASVISVLVLILFGILFVGGFGSFAQLLGEKSQDISIDEKTKFIGEWTSETMEVTFLSDNTFSTTTGEGSFEIKNMRLTLHHYYYGTNEEFDYDFSDDEEILTLTNSVGSIVLTRK
jgi:hypothetical protein